MGCKSIVSQINIEIVITEGAPSIVVAYRLTHNSREYQFDELSGSVDQLPVIDYTNQEPTTQPLCKSPRKYEDDDLPF